MGQIKKQTNQELELELTFLAKKIPKEIDGSKPTRIMDIYIPDTPNRSYLRLRQKGSKFEITKKAPINNGDASAQIEQTIALTEKEFIALSISSQKRVVKDRYEVTINGKSAEVDIFVDQLKGLVLIDFEFSTEKEKDNFIAPDNIVLSDVTQEDFIAGGLLAGKTYNDISLELDRFNYSKLS